MAYNIVGWERGCLIPCLLISASEVSHLRFHCAQKSSLELLGRVCGRVERKKSRCVAVVIQDRYVVEMKEQPSNATNPKPVANF